MKKTSGLMIKRNKIIPNERRRQTWRKHRLNLIDRRSKWFYQHQNDDDSTAATSQDTETDTTEDTAASKDS